VPRAKRSFPLLLLLLAAAVGGCAQAPVQPPAGAKPEICDVAVARDPRSGEVTVTWSGGTPPFQVIRGDAPRFDRAREVDWLAERATERRLIDSRAREPDQRYYYQVYDFNSSRELFSEPEHSHAKPGEHEREEEKPPPDNNYCRGVLRRPVTWK